MKLILRDTCTVYGIIERENASIKKEDKKSNSNWKTQDAKYIRMRDNELNLNMVFNNYIMYWPEAVNKMLPKKHNKNFTTT